MSQERADETEERRRRARERAGRVTVRRVSFDSSDDEIVGGADGILLAAMLSRAAWSISGRPLPRLSRAELPYLFVQRS